MNISIPSQAKKALDLLSKNGYEAYVVGGCIRDSLLSINPPDWDITTSAKPEQIINSFKNHYNVYKTGIKHGTVTVVIDKVPLEITSFRIDGEYKDNRHPENVKFCSDLSEDLKRRDFTINAMAYNDKIGLVDKFGSIEDLNNKIIRCVGNPDKRFNEDALRILRALRFSSVLGFNIEQNTSNSIHRNAHLLINVSKERISKELLKLLCGKNVVNVLLEFRDVIAYIIPEVEPTFDFDQKTKYHIFDVWQHIVYAVGFSESTPLIRFSVLLHDIGKPQCFKIDEKGIGHFYGHGKASANIASKIVKDLKLSNEFSNEVVTLVRYHDYVIKPDIKPVKRCLNKFSVTTFDNLLKVKEADILAHNPEYAYGVKDIEKIREIKDKIIEDGNCFKLKDLAINGKDLLNIGLPEGKEIGDVLQLLLKDVINENIPNERTALLEKAKVIYGGKCNE